MRQDDSQIRHFQPPVIPAKAAQTAPARHPGESRGGVAKPLTRALSAVALGALVLGGLAACTQGNPGHPALPKGFEERGVPEVDLNAYFYFNNGKPVTLPIEATAQIGGADVTVEAEARVVSVEGVMRQPEREVGTRVEFTDEAMAMLAAGQAKKSAGDEPNAWVETQGTALVAGRSGDDWGADVRAAWKDGRYASIRSRYPEAWGMIQLLPANPPKNPVAAGFALNVSDLLEEMLAARDVDVPGLGSALGLIRVDSLAFAAYARDLSSLPAEVTADTVNEMGLGVVAVTKAGYPSFVVNFLLGQFGSRAGLEEATVDGHDVLYRLVDEHLHLMEKNYGAFLFLVAAPTKVGAEDLMRSVIADQG